MSTRRTLLANFFEIALDRYCTIQISRKKKRCFFEYKFCVISNWQVEDLNNNTEAIKQTVRHFPKIFNEQMYVLTSRKRFLYLQLIFGFIVILQNANKSFLGLLLKHLLKSHRFAHCLQ